MKTFMKIFRWAINIVTILLLLVTVYIVGAHIVEPMDGHNWLLHEIYKIIAMGLLFIGSFIALWRRILGGAISVLAFAIFGLLHGDIMLGPLFYSFLVIGIVNLVLGFYYKNK